MQYHGLLGTPRKHFQSDLLNAIAQWLKNGNRLLIFIDMNKNILTGFLPIALQQLGLVKAPSFELEQSRTLNLCSQRRMANRRCLSHN
jgi:hypothetical protein